MQVILLQRIKELGNTGDTVRVRDGYAKNFLLPQGKALRANKANLERFERERAQFEALNLERKGEAEAVASKLIGESLVMIRSAGETGQLYGSVSTRDIAEGLTETGFAVARNQVELRSPIKTIGLHNVLIQLHPEVEVFILVNVARSENEAVRQAAGEDLTTSEQDVFEFEEEEVWEIEEEHDLVEDKTLVVFAPELSAPLSEAANALAASAEPITAPSEPAYHDFSIGEQSKKMLDHDTLSKRVNRLISAPDFRAQTSAALNLVENSDKNLTENIAKFEKRLRKLEA